MKLEAALSVLSGVTPSAFKQATLDHGTRVHSYAAWMLGDVEDARDITQECFMRLWMRHGDVHSAAARTWLLRTAHRLCIDRFRRPELAPHRVVSAHVAAEPDADALRADDRDRLRAGLDRLSARDRSLLLLRETHGLSLDEIGGIVDAPVGTIKTWLHRARAELRAAMAPTDAAPVLAPESTS